MISVVKACFSYVVTCLLLCGLTGCAKINRLAVYDLSAIYRQQEPGYDDVAISHLNDSLSEVNIKSIRSSPGKDKSMAAGIRLRYYLYPSYELSVLLDSSTINLPDSGENRVNCRGYRFIVKTGKQENYILKVEWTDRSSGKNYQVLKAFNKTKNSPLSRAVAIDGITGCKTGTLVGEKEFSIHTGNEFNGILQGVGFSRRFPPAMPPFISESRPPFDYLPDSTYSFDVVRGSSSLLHFNRPGFTLFRADTMKWEGLTLCNMGTGYPLICTSTQMLEPLRYITSGKEYAAIAQGADLKPAIDSFWIANAGNTARALEMIRDYYSRVEQANRLFFSFCEGWKTDRGMIYIVFGSPNQVFRSDTEEVWYYGEANNFKSLQFRFYKVLNPFTENDYILQRQPTYKTYWYNAIQLWRR